jgi:hypothetical protein
MVPTVSIITQEDGAGRETAIDSSAPEKPRINPEPSAPIVTTRPISAPENAASKAGAISISLSARLDQLSAEIDRLSGTLDRRQVSQPVTRVGPDTSATTDKSVPQVTLVERHEKETVRQVAQERVRPAEPIQHRPDDASSNNGEAPQSDAPPTVVGPPARPNPPGPKTGESDPARNRRPAAARHVIIERIEKPAARPEPVTGLTRDSGRRQKPQTAAPPPDSQRRGPLPASPPAPVPGRPAAPRPVPRIIVEKQPGDQGTSEPTVNVTIGRIEVRTPRDQASAPPRPKRPEPNIMSLDEYLRRRAGGVG